MLFISSLFQVEKLNLDTNVNMGFFYMPYKV
jgi:hypothetical protein